MSSNTGETKKKVIDAITSSDEEIVSNCLTQYKKLSPLKTYLIETIATLEDKFIREVVCLSALSLLRSRSCYERFMKKIRDFATDKTSIPRSLRVKIKLTPAMPNSVRKPKYMAAEEKAKETIAKFQKAFKSHFMEVKECDRDEAHEAHTGNFFKILIQLLDAKSCYTLAKSPPSTQKVFQNNDRYLSAIVILKVFNTYGKEKEQDNTIEVLEVLEVEEIEKEPANDIAAAIFAESTTSPQHNNQTTKETADKTEEMKNDIQWLDALTQYLNLPYNEIKDKAVKALLEESTTKNGDLLLHGIKGKAHAEPPIQTVTNFLSSIIPSITSKLTDTYNESLKELQAQHQALRRIKDSKTQSATEDVHRAISEEPSMEPKNMKNLMHKVIDKRLNQNGKGTDKRKRVKNLKGEKKVSFSNAPHLTTNNNKVNNQPASSTLTSINNKKRKATKHPNKQNQSNKSQQEEQHQQQPTQNKKKRKKTFKSKKWVRPKSRNADHQDA